MEADDDLEWCEEEEEEETVKIGGATATTISANQFVEEAVTESVNIPDESLEPEEYDSESDDDTGFVTDEDGSSHVMEDSGTSNIPEEDDDTSHATEESDGVDQVTEADGTGQLMGEDTTEDKSYDLETTTTTGEELPEVDRLELEANTTVVNDDNDLEGDFLNDTVVDSFLDNGNDFNKLNMTNMNGTIETMKRRRKVSLCHFFYFYRIECVNWQCIC